MIPGEYDVQDGQIKLNEGRNTITITVENTGDRPIQVGSHYHFYETNLALSFDREATIDKQLGQLDRSSFIVVAHRNESLTFFW